jgi:putative aminopeptidase FrvX
MKQLIKNLVETTGPSGFESEIRSLVRAEVESYVDEIRVDALGSLITRKGRKAEGGKRIMIAAHIDEIGIMVTHIDDNGFLRFTNIGGVNPLNLSGGRVRFVNGTAGVIGVESPRDRGSMPTIDKFYIDVGARNKTDCPVKVGDAAVFDRPFEDLGERLVSKAMDDRIGAAIMIQALKELKSSPNELYFVFTTQEEVGLRGATTSAYGIDPEIGIAVDITGVGDTPNSDKMAVALGKGPALKVKDRSLVVDPRILDWMVRTAERENLPYQYEVLTYGGTDAGAMNLTRAGVPSTCISIPTRYAHSPSEMVDYQDVLNCVKLLMGAVSQPITLE